MFRRPHIELTVGKSLRAVLILACLALFAVRGPTLPADGDAVPKTPAGPVSTDWPMDSYDARRSSSSPVELPHNLKRQWTMHLPPLEPVWPDQPRMHGEHVYCPIIMSGRLILASPGDDSVAAYDLGNGNELWRMFTGGPVRCSPAGWKDRIFVGSDDGFLYALRVTDGSVLWKFKGVPKQRLALGNGRLIDTWPIRGGPVVADGADGKPVVYFAAGLWPFMGIYLHCLDAETGNVVWTNSGDGPAYQIQPHNSPSFAGISPQGPLAVSGDRLLIPNGRAVPACYDRFTGKFRYFQLPTRSGGDHVVLGADAFFNDGVAFNLQDGKPKGMLEKTLSLPVVDGETAYASTASGICAFDLANAVAGANKVAGSSPKRYGAIGISPVKEMEVAIRAGNQLFAGGKERLVALDLPLDANGSTPAWESDVSGSVGELAAGAGHLVAITREGGVFCYGDGKGTSALTEIPSAPKPSPALEAPSTPGQSPGLTRPDGTPDRPAIATPTTPALPLFPPAPTITAGVPPTTEPAFTDIPGQVWNLLTDAQQSSGWAIGLGKASVPLVREIVRQSRMDCVIVEPSAEVAGQIRRELLHDGVYGARVSVLVGDMCSLPFPAYFASLVVGALPAPVVGADNKEADCIAAIFRALHPFHGRAYLSPRDGQKLPAEQWSLTVNPAHCSISPFADMVRISRFGGIDGGGNWTREHADESNTRVSADTVVKAPLGILWWGGSSHDGILPRHGHGPAPQVLDGRVFIEGPDMMRAMDIYTGQVLWDAMLPGVGSFYNNTAHQVGANGVGSNFITLHDGIFVAMAKSCVQLDPATGKTLKIYPLPSDPESGPDAVWSYVNASGHYLIGGVSRPPKLLKLSTVNSPGRDLDEPPADASTNTTQPVTNPRTVGSHELFILDRRTGKVVWSVKATSEFRHNAICIGGGRLYTIDRAQGKDKGMILFGLGSSTQPAKPDGPPARLTAFDLATGQVIWSTEANVFGTWLSYSKQYEVLMEAGRLARDTLKDEPKGMRAYRADTGQVLWNDPNATGPAMIRGQEVLKESSGANLLTGAPVERVDPLTGDEIEWTWMRMYGCNTPAASQNLLTFRSGAAGYYDLNRLSGTGNFGGFRSSCTNNLIVAGGILCAPDYTRNCTCSYQIQTSLALVPDKEVEMWTFLGNTTATKSRIRRVGINLGAPGDRLADNGTLWLEHPNSGGPDPVVKVETAPDNVEFFRRHSMAVPGPLPWVTSSGARGIRKIKVGLNGDPELPCNYTVKLYFAEPLCPESNNCIVDVAIAGETVDRGVDVVKLAGGYDRAIVREYHGIRALEDITVELTPSNATSIPILCGMEIIEEGPSHLARGK